MQYLNNDMDDLMRKAAEHYPLKPTGADWDKVARQLEVPTDPPVANVQTAVSKRYFLLLAFLLASLVCNKYRAFSFIKEKAGRSSVAVVDKAPALQSTDPLSTAVPAQKSELTAGNENLTLFKSAEQKPLLTRNENTSNAWGVSIDHFDQAEVKVNTGQKSKTEAESGKGDSTSLAIVSNSHALKTDAPIIEPATPIVANKNEEPLKAEAENKPVINKQEKGSNDKKWYAGVLFGPDISTVKMQKVKATGYSVGVVLGHRLSKKWAVETGLFWDRKNYYTEGQHFNTEKIYLPTHSKVLEANGYCNMFEIPINLRYTFKQGEKSQWFAIAGVSSYLMQNEEYDYLYERYNVQYYSNKYFKASSKNWLSVMNLSMGYERPVGKWGSVRVEPYIKVPLQGIGIGRLPLTSTGIQAGFTYHIR